MSGCERGERSLAFCGWCGSSVLCPPLLPFGVFLRCAVFVPRGFKVLSRGCVAVPLAFQELCLRLLSPMTRPSRRVLPTRIVPLRPVTQQTLRQQRWQEQLPLFVADVALHLRASLLGATNPLTLLSLARDACRRICTRDMRDAFCRRQKAHRVQQPVESATTRFAA